MSERYGGNWATADFGEKSKPLRSMSSLKLDAETRMPDVAAVSESGVKHIWCNVRDVEEANIKEHFGTAYDAIERSREKGEAIFVHCSRGVSRSASLCIAYLMRKEGWDVVKARSFVEKCRPIILPNEGFWTCLQEYEKEAST